MKRSRKRTLVRRTASHIRAIVVVAFMSLLLMWNIPVSAYSRAGDLDPSFGDDGKVFFAFPGYNSIVCDIAIQPDGRVVTAGFAEGGPGDPLFALARFNMDGTLDATFGSIGWVLTDIGEGTDRIYAMALLPNGKIVVVGEAGGGFGVARYNSDGTLDTTFGSGGKVVTHFFGGYDYPRALAVQDDGKILVAGTVRIFADRAFGLVRYNSDGSLDESFGDDGQVVTEMGSEAYVWSIGIQSGGKIVVGGTSFGTNGDFALARYKTNGKLDRSFGTYGKVITDFHGYSDEAYGLKIQADDKIVLAGYADTEGGYPDFALARYNADGSLDQTFGTGGRVSTQYIGFNSIANGLTIQADGKIVAAGSRYRVWDDDFAVARYNTNGSLDTTFGEDGKVVTEFSGSWDIASAVTIAPTGRIIVGGYAGAYHFAVACYLSKGTPNITGAAVGGKKLFLYGTDFDEGAVIYLNGVIQKTKNDLDRPDTVLIGKKAGNKIAPGQTVMLQVRCSDGRLSNEYRFTRPMQ